MFGPEGWIGEFELAVGGPDKPAFFGLFSDVPIVRLNLADADGAYAEAVDNIAFGTSVSKVPEPSVLSIFFLTGLGYVIRSLRTVAV